MAEWRQQPSQELTLDLSVLAELKPQIIREMPEDEVAKQMYLNDLLTMNEWKEYKQKKKDIKKYLLDCLSHKESGFLENFCFILRKPECHAASLAKRISTKKNHALAKVSRSTSTYLRDSNEHEWAGSLRKLKKNESAFDKSSEDVVISDNSSGSQPSSSSGEDSADSSSSADYNSYSDKSSGKLSDGMPSHTKPFTGLMSDKQSNSDSDGTCAITAVQESHNTNSASRASNRCVKKPFTNTQLKGYNEFIKVHKRITGRYNQ